MEQLSHKDLLEQLDLVNRKLLASETMKSNFLSNIRNEINNPLASVLELSRNMTHPGMSVEQIRKFAKLIHSEIFQLDFQLRNVFLSAEIEAGETGLSIAAVDINKLLQNLAGSFGHLLEKKKLNLVLQDELGPTNRFRTDAEKLHLILSNLLANAIQYSPENGNIHIIASLQEEQLCIVVSDEGPGISEATRALLFDRFRQGEEGPAKNYAGQGLGLSVTQALLEMIDGHIALDSSEGKGSHFRIRVAEQATSSGDQALSDDGNDLLFNDEALTF